MLLKRLFDLTISVLILLFLFPLILLISLTIVIFSGGPVIFKQKRAGIMKKEFTMYKFRTMYLGAEKKQRKLKLFNEVDGPVFKIYDDPRYTKFGKLLAHTGLDELPQLVNVLKGEMSLVGPRPLPIEEASMVPEKYAKRFSVLPGITSSWIVEGSHAMSFDEWMKLDMQYLKKWTIWEDIKILYSTCRLMAGWVFRKIFD